MPTTDFLSSTDKGVQLKVSDFIKDPTLVQSVMANMLDKQFIADALLRQAPDAPGGVVKFFSDESLFATGIEIIAEYGEIPVAKGVDGTPQAVFTRRGGGALLISEDMQRRNSIDIATKRMRQIKNAMVRFWDDAFMQAVLTNGSIPTYAVPLAWSDTTSKVRYDTSKASEVVLAQLDSNGNEYGFMPDTLVVNPLRESAFGYNDDIAKVYNGNIAGESKAYTGDTLRNVGKFRVMTSWRIPQNKAVLLEKKTVGFISDERALRTTPMYEQRERESWRADTTRVSAVGIDAPKAAVILTGV